MCINDIISYEEVMDIISLKNQISVGSIDESCLDVILMEFFSKLLTYTSDNLQSRIELDLLRSSIDFSFSKGFSAVEISKLLSIVMHIHASCICTVNDNLAQTHIFFKELMRQCCINRIPVSTSLFSSEQSHSLVDYFTLTYFSHFHLYKFVFTSRSSLQLHVHYNPF
eukprot:TRINITY_DN19023_c0_g1_i1.p1 TRINITY_DN19023_c0_g1~~TRINITY_DN19023_c0_g1_i1.p1  ORF type:complete len:168 (+),score=5.94 TRINITY_DN19023_c0_g1_i1:326-829(+)